MQIHACTVEGKPFHSADIHDCKRIGHTHSSFSNKNNKMKCNVFFYSYGWIESPKDSSKEIGLSKIKYIKYSCKYILTQKKKHYLIALI